MGAVVEKEDAALAKKEAKDFFEEDEGTAAEASASTPIVGSVEDQVAQATSAFKSVPMGKLQEEDASYIGQLPTHFRNFFKIMKPSKEFFLNGLNNENRP